MRDVGRKPPHPSRHTPRHLPPRRRKAFRAAGSRPCEEISSAFARPLISHLLPLFCQSRRDTTRIYSRDFIFTASDFEVAKRLKQAQLGGYPVRVEYRRYHATVPWRGSSKTVVTAVDSVDASTILPPEFAPRY